MTQYEYKVIAAPTKGQKVPGVKSAEARFACAVEGLMNDMAEEGWSYLRSDLLPSEERQGLTSSQIVYRSLLVFRREKQPAHDDTAPPDKTDTAWKEAKVIPPKEPAAEPHEPGSKPAGSLGAQPITVDDEPKDPFSPR